MEKPWLKNYPEGIPATLTGTNYESIAELFRASCKEFSEQVAFSNLGIELTYAELLQSAEQFAAYLQQVLKLKPGVRIALMMPNILQYPIALFGSLMAGLVVVNVNPLYTPVELAHQLKDSGAEVLVVLSNFANTVELALERLEKVALKHVIVTELGDLFAQPKAWLVNFTVKYVKKMVPAWYLPHAINYRTLMQKAQRLTFKPVAISSEDIAFLQYTGGTTGVAKGAILTHRNMVSNVAQAYTWIKPFLKSDNEVIITALPLYHIFSLTANCLTFLRVGAENVLVTNPRDIDGFVKLLQQKPFSAMTGVNTLFNALLNHPDFEKVDFEKFKFTLGGGMAVQRSVAEKWHAVTGVVLLEAYGLTEASPAVAINPLSLEAFNGSIGLPIPATEVKIIDEEGNELPQGHVGELAVRGPQVMRGYWQKPLETQQVLMPDGWLLTGDVASIDESGFIFLKERKKDLIIVSGFNVYPNEVEEVIAQHEGVCEVAVIGVPDHGSSETVKAYIVANDEELTAEAIIAFCRQQLTRYKVPKHIEFKSELPKINVGKILRRALKEEAEKAAVKKDQVVLNV